MSVVVDEAMDIGFGVISDDAVLGLVLALALDVDESLSRIFVVDDSAVEFVAVFQVLVCHHDLDLRTDPCSLFLVLGLCRCVVWAEESQFDVVPELVVLVDVLDVLQLRPFLVGDADAELVPVEQSLGQHVLADFGRIGREETESILVVCHDYASSGELDIRRCLADVLYALVVDGEVGEYHRIGGLSLVIELSDGPHSDEAHEGASEQSLDVGVFFQQV